MRLIFALIIAAIASSVYADQNYIDATGTVKNRTVRDIVVVNSAASALTVGKAVCLDLTADDGISVDFCAAKGDKAHCVILDTSCAVGARCTCRREGFLNNGAFNAWIDVYQPATAGSVLYADDSGYIVAKSSASIQYEPIAIALDSSTATGDLQIYIYP